MSPETKDQVAGTSAEGQSKDAPLGLDEQFDKGWEQVELLTSEESKAKGKPAGEPKAIEKKEPGEPAQKAPYKVLKVGGKEIPVQTEEEFIALAQKGADYTKKTQALADDRRTAEGELKTKSDGLESQAARMNELLDRLVAAGIVPEKVAAAKKAAAAEAGDAAETEGKVSDGDAAIFKEFEMDPANAYPHEKNIVRSLAELRRDLQDIRLERATEVVEKAIAEERENFPFDDIKDDQGVDLTRKQFGAMMSLKRQAAGIQKPTVDQVATWARETVREFHDLQKKGNAGDISDDMDPKEFAKRFPKLAASVKTEAGARAIEEAEDAKAKLPPTIKPTPRPSDLTRRQKVDTGGRKSFDDWLNEGFSDPDTIKALSGG